MRLILWLLLALVVIALLIAGQLSWQPRLSAALVLNAAALAFVGAALHWRQMDGQAIVIFILAVAATEVAVGLAAVIAPVLLRDDPGSGAVLVGGAVAVTVVGLGELGGQAGHFSVPYREQALSQAKGAPGI